MNCPHCSHQLIILELNQIEVDYCTSCHGVWLDEGELELLLQDSDDEHAGIQGKDKLLNSFLADKKSKEKSIKCPMCSKKMNKVFAGGEEKVTIDVCPAKDGIWFDKGELQRVVETGSLDKENKIVSMLKEMFSYNLS